MSIAQNARLLRRGDVQRRTGLSKSTMYSLIACGQFPAPVKVSPRTSAWIESEISTWIAQRVARRDLMACA